MSVRSLVSAADRRALLERLRRLRPDAERRWGSLTAPEMVLHLADAFRMFTGEKPTTARSDVLKRTLVKWIAIHAPLPWPPGIPTSPELDPRGGGTPSSGDFAADVIAVEVLMERLASGGEPSAPHPYFGAMSRAEWMIWGWRHVDHHLRQFGL